MKVKNLNASSRKTKVLIKEAFAKLMEEKKELANISVTELVSLAGITRSSFYTHYSSIYDVAKDLQDETLELLNAKHIDINNLKEVNNYLDEVIEYLKTHEKIYRMLLKSNEPLWFADKLNRIIATELYNALKDTHQKNLDLKVTFFTDGCINLIIKHFRNEINNSLDEIREYIKELFFILFFKNK